MKKILLVIPIIVFSILTISISNSCQSNKKQESTQANKAYSCPMHPEIKSDKPGLCSKCGMELIKQEKKNLKETYTCPMHPEVTSDKPGTCSKCGMNLEIKQEKSVYLCPGRCEYLSNTPGKCPNCNMTLITKSSNENRLTDNHSRTDKNQTVINHKVRVEESLNKHQKDKV
jgi:predicted RNA-binding Zn-ribbon protein involved in translation (DUF1610 family)